MNRDTMVWVADLAQSKPVKRTLFAVVTDRFEFFHDEAEARRVIAEHLLEKADEASAEAREYQRRAAELLDGPLLDDNHRENDASGEPDHGSR